MRIQVLSLCRFSMLAVRGHHDHSASGGHLIGRNRLPDAPAEAVLVGRSGLDRAVLAAALME